MHVEFKNPYIHFGRLPLSNTNLSIKETMSQSDKCMSQYDAIVSHAHKACDSL